MITFDGVVVDADRLLGAEGGAARARSSEAMDLGAAAACAEGVGHHAAPCSP